MLLGGPHYIVDRKRINGVAFWRKPISENRMFKRFSIPCPHAVQKNDLRGIFLQNLFMNPTKRRKSKELRIIEKTRININVKRRNKDDQTTKNGSAYMA
jgi:hypothetical protein